MSILFSSNIDILGIFIILSFYNVKLFEISTFFFRTLIISQTSFFLASDSIFGYVVNIESFSFSKVLLLNYHTKSFLSSFRFLICLC